MTTRTFDVIIVGAGPAGTACAITLAKTGLKVALLDKANFPRDKTCGDALSVDVINQLSLLSDSLLNEYQQLNNKVPSYGVRIFSPDHNHVDIPFIYKGEKSKGFITPRMDFDNLMFQHIRQYPTISVLENCDVKAVNTEDKVTVTTNKGIFHSDIIVGADGAHSIVAKCLGNIAVEKKHYSAGLRVYYDNVSSFHCENYIELHFLKDVLPGYLWIFPLAENRANVGLAMLSSTISKHKVNLKETLTGLLQTNPHLKDRFINAKALETIKGYGLPLGSKKRMISGNRYLLTGDAAALIDPFSGEGIGNAIRSGRVGAEHILKCFDQKDFSAAFNKAYDKEIYRRMWGEFKISRTLQHVVRYPLLFNFVVRKAMRSKYLQHFLIEALANPEKKKKILYKPAFYFRMLVNGKADKAAV